MAGLSDGSDAKLAMGLIGLALAIGVGCSERPKPQERPSARVANFRKIPFAGDWVVVPFQSGVTTAEIPEPSPGFVPKTGDRVILSDAGNGEIFVGADLESLQFYHSSPGREQLDRFRSLAETAKLFIVPKGTTAIVAKVVDGKLPDGLKAIELRLLGEPGGVAWVSETFVRSLREKPAAP